MEEQKPSTKNWRGFLFRQYPTIALREAEKIRKQGMGGAAGAVPLKGVIPGAIPAKSSTEPDLPSAIYEVLCELSPKEKAVVYFVFAGGMEIEDLRDAAEDAGWDGTPIKPRGNKISHKNVSKALNLPVEEVDRIVEKASEKLKASLKDWA